MASSTNLASGSSGSIELVCLDESDKVVEKKHIELVCLDESEEECGICLELLQDVATLSSCRHRFCFKCISQWMEKKMIARIARGNLTRFLAW